MTTLVWAGRRDGQGPFHTHDGWYFHRDDVGQVLIQHRGPRSEGGDGWEVDASVILDAATWASVVREMSPWRRVPDTDAQQCEACGTVVTGLAYVEGQETADSERNDHV